eukprot:CAMPEP_0113899378 /NCGR_PEP_ID=MMETSP0780_2-20120614/19990_1 /TAXON_ID=652834 /ORGANISM="Palpitomonas bilix" /LENGTH=595 /DNA_ID=CAMNT_0000891523 /DNA_START=1392 /DNA_END=3179 /DNA_ORIENTATION=- /assembly_acc=CAM_ASM_000599
MTSPPMSSPSSPLGGDHSDATRLHELLEKRMEYLRQHPQYIQPVLQRRGERVRWEDADAEDGNNEANEVRELVEALVFGPPNAKVGAWFRDGQVEDPETVKSICKIRAGLLYLLVQHDQWREVDDLLRRLAVTFRLVGLESWKWDVQHQTLVDLLNLLASTWVLCVPRDGVIPDLPPPSCDEKKKVPAFVRLILCVGHLREYLLDSLVGGDASLPSSKFPRGLVESLLKHSIFERFDASLLQSSRRTWLKKAFPTSYALIQEKKEQEKKTSPSFPFPNSSLPAPSSSSRPYFSIPNGISREEQWKELEEALDLSPLEGSELLPVVDERCNMVSLGAALDRISFAPLPLSSPNAVSWEDGSFSPLPDREVAQAERTLFSGFDSYLTNDHPQLVPPRSPSSQQRTGPSDEVIRFRGYRRWTEEEDKILEEGIKAGESWEEIEKALKTRLREDAKQRLRSINRRKEGNLKSLNWTKAMEISLYQKVIPFFKSKQRIPWTHISNEMSAEFNMSLSHNACKKKWEQQLKPGIELRSVTEEEKQKIINEITHDKDISVKKIQEKIPSLANVTRNVTASIIRQIKKKYHLQRLMEKKGKQPQ